MFKPLHPFAPLNSTVAIRAKIEARSDGILIRFECKAGEKDFASISLPFSETQGKRRDELWKTTCFECFFGIEGSTEYFELNTSPNGDWAWYSFSDYRKDMRAPALSAGSEPRLLSARKTMTSFESEWLIPVMAFEANKVKDASITAVLDQAGDTSFWALTHTGKEADFHLRASFVAGLNSHD